MMKNVIILFAFLFLRNLIRMSRTFNYSNRFGADLEVRATFSLRVISFPPSAGTSRRAVGNLPSDTLR